MNLHTDILDEERRGMLPLLKQFQKEFYLAGGTALALQIGHRDSIDFDFFSEESFDTGRLFEQSARAFAGHQLLKIQDEKDTLTYLVDESVSMSFLGFPYPLLEPLITTEYLTLASIGDIGCMKLSAITSRSTLKDYVDLYFILKTVPLQHLLAACAMKFPMIDRNLVLKSLVYFDDIAPEPIRFAPGHEVPLEEIKKSLEREVRSILGVV